MKKLWARVGMELSLEDREYETLENYMKTKDVSKAEEFIVSFIEAYIHKGSTKCIISGETYFPPESATCGYDNPSSEDNWLELLI